MKAIVFVACIKIQNIDTKRLPIIQQSLILSAALALYFFHAERINQLETSSNGLYGFKRPSGP